MPSIKWNWFT